MELRVDNAGVQAMAARWGGFAGELSHIAAPQELGLPCQTSAAAVDAAHAEVVNFLEGLAARVGGHARGVAAADANYVAHETDSASAMSAVGE